MKVGQCYICSSFIYTCFTHVWGFFCKSGEAPSQWEIEETVRFKELYDQDKDGRLDREEQLRWVAPNSYGSAREEVSFDAPIRIVERKTMQLSKVSRFNCMLSLKYKEA